MFEGSKIHGSQPIGKTPVALEVFREVNRTFPGTAEIREWHSNGKKIFGWLCTYVPEEILHAGGILPVRITGYDRETELDEGNAYLYNNNCSFSRSCLQMGLTGQYKFLDGVVGGSTCDGARRLFDLWREYIGTPFHHVLTVPRKYTDRAHRLYLEEVGLFKRHLEEHLGINITDESLMASIELYNQTRLLLKDLYELRKNPSPPISGAQVMEVLDACFRMPKESFNLHLKALLEELKKSPGGYSGRARLMISGSVLANPDFIASIEQQGGMVVADELCTSTRYWGDRVDIKEGDSLLAALARRYLNNYPCARMFPSEERFRRIVETAGDFKVDGVISEIIRYCVPYSHDLPLLTKRLADFNIPVLSIDLEYGSSGSGQVATRVQAFLEMIEARK
ncbi:MAG: 2-hydroxyacyl-CoA dehydratase family protein [Dehalococcoidales bacterium]|nr:2-hydroxyacyl-CoA dehydratase family protein [Dehalococcoidales bacterium]